MKNDRQQEKGKKITGGTWFSSFTIEEFSCEEEETEVMKIYEQEAEAILTPTNWWALHLAR